MGFDFKVTKSLFPTWQNVKSFLQRKFLILYLVLTLWGLNLIQLSVFGWIEYLHQIFCVTFHLSNSLLSYRLFSRNWLLLNLWSTFIGLTNLMSLLHFDQKNSIKFQYSVNKYLNCRALKVFNFKNEKGLYLNSFYQSSVFFLILPSTFDFL